MKITPFLLILNQIKIYHWQTNSFAEHKAFNKAYDTLGDLFDKFIETWYGKYGKPNSESIEYSITLQGYRESMSIDEVRKDLNYFITTVRDQLNPNDSEFDNLLQEIQTEFNQLLYLLTLK